MKRTQERGLPLPLIVCVCVCELKDGRRGGEVGMGYEVSIVIKGFAFNQNKSDLKR